MNKYNRVPESNISVANIKIASFLDVGDNKNLDPKTVHSFGEEWKKFDSFDYNEIRIAGDEYFDIVTDKIISKDSLVLDMGCGTGRWTKYIADKVGFVEAVDPSEAVFSAAGLLKDTSNVRITRAFSSNLPFAKDSFDFVFSLGVLHHIPDTLSAMKDCVQVLKPGGHFLCYLYYDLDNRGQWFRMVFRLSAIIRSVVSRMPSFLKKITCDAISILIYLPLIFLVRFLKTIGVSSAIYKKIPLWYYHNKSLRIIRNDALDRFGTPLEQRFTKTEIRVMMEKSGLKDIVFSENAPYWHAVGRKA